jgi:hypothetical protein
MESMEDTHFSDRVPAELSFWLFDLEDDLGETEIFLRRHAPFSGIIVVNYLFRPLLPLLPELLAEKGLLLYETFMRGQEGLGRPKNPDFLLQPGELLETFQGSLWVLEFEEGQGLDGRPEFKQRFCGLRKGSNDKDVPPQA